MQIMVNGKKIESCYECPYIDINGLEPIQCGNQRNGHYAYFIPSQEDIKTGFPKKCPEVARQITKKIEPLEQDDAFACNPDFYEKMNDNALRFMINVLKGRNKKALNSDGPNGQLTITVPPDFFIDNDGEHIFDNDKPWEEKDQAVAWAIDNTAAAGPEIIAAYREYIIKNLGEN